MAVFDDYKLNNRALTGGELKASRDNLIRATSPTTLINPGIDDLWASFSDNSRAPNAYLDYFFTGEDMKVYVAELEDDQEFGDLPIAGLSVQVEQEKAPVYGFWSRTYDAVMRGTRLVQGQFMLYSKDPDYMKRLLIKAAVEKQRNRGNLQDDYPMPETWREDDRNLASYWGQTLDPAARAQGGSIHSAHPPFSLVVVYGVQDGSVELSSYENVYNSFDDDSSLYFDTNQRLVESQSKSSRFVLDSCEITSMQQTISPGGFVMETYSFFARDIVVPAASRGIIGNTGNDRTKN